MTMPLAHLAVLLTLAAADPTLDEVRPDVKEQLVKAEGQLGNFEEQEALATLDGVAARLDLTASEVAHIQLWRGVVLMALLRTADAQGAFALSRGCNPLVEAPASMSPKVRQAFSNAVPADCPVGGLPQDPTEGLETKTTPQPAAAQKAAVPPVAPLEPRPPATAAPGGGPSPLRLAGVGLGAAGALVLVACAVGAAAGVGLLVASFPLMANAQAQEQAVDVLQGARVAFGVRVGGGLMLVVAAAVGLLAVATAGGGVALAAMNLGGE